MDDNAARAHLLHQPEAWEDYPFGPDVAVFKIRSKIFATLGYELEHGHSRWFNSVGRN